MTDFRKLFDLTGKTAVVLGAASGIGKSSAEALAGLGAQVLCADISHDAAEATAAGIRAVGGVASAAVCDAADRSSVMALVSLSLVTSSKSRASTSARLFSIIPRRISTACSISTSRARCTSSRHSAA